MIEEVVSCNYDDSVWLWAHGWANKRKFKGSCLSKARYLDTLEPGDERLIVRSKVHHGWVITVAGDTSGCGWDMTMYFEKEEPVVVEGRWDGASVYDDEGDEQPAEVVDGPHQATWLEIDFPRSGGVTINPLSGEGVER